MKKTLATSFYLILLTGFLLAQNTRISEQAELANPVKQTQYTIKWKGLQNVQILKNEYVQFLSFENASYKYNPAIPYFILLKSIPQISTSFTISLVNPRYVELTQTEANFLNSNISITSEVEIENQIIYNKGKKQALATILPFRKNPTTGKAERLTAFDIKLIPNTDAAKKAPDYNRVFAANSVLNSGNWYKIAVAKNGVYKLDYNFLKNLGIDVDNIDPKNLRIYGNGGGMLPFANNVFRPDDLLENAIYVEGETDGNFNTGDFVLFYGESPNEWTSATTEFDFTKNLYSDSTYYFITTDLGLGKRIQNQASETNFNVTVNTFNDFKAHESDLKNLIKTGRRWFGEEFNIVTSYDFVFSFPNVVTSSPAKLDLAVAAHCVGCTSNNTFTIQVIGQSSILNLDIASVSSGYTAKYADIKANEISFNPSSSTFNIKVDYSKPKPDGVGWLDYLVLNVRRKLTMAGEQMHFRDLASLNSGIAKYKIASVNNIRVWEVTDAHNIKEQQFTLNGTTAEFNTGTDSLRTFVAFKDQGFLTPSKVGKVENQNLHGLPQADMMIVTAPTFLSHANEVAEFHRDEDNMTVNVVTTKQIYNEYSSGAQDITAIKDFMKMFYDRAWPDTTQRPKYLLLFGDGSYDPKDRVPGNTNFVPTYQSWESTVPTTSYVSDDYYGLLDNHESDGASQLIDIGIGRLPVKNKTEAQNVVNKIKHYYTQQTMGPWRNWLAFIGDDEDNNLHMKDSDSLANKAGSLYPEYNIDKLYFDAYKQESTPGGERYPAVKAEINNRIAKGALMMTYVGHGGELGWSHERVLEVSDINSWENFDNMPLFLTATCEFSRYDDPQRTAGGEFVLLNPNGGGIALLTTTRLVYSHPNLELAKAFYENAFAELDGAPIKLGDLYHAVKTDSKGLGVNSRNFSLLGDPALTLAYPKFEVITTKINGNNVSSADTIQALSKVTVTGFVADHNGQKMTNFNGVVYPTVFDKATDIQTLNNDGDGVFSFQLQKNLIFKGKASVKNGDFEFTFVVPKDIAYKYGQGRISYYAENGETDANGYHEGFTVGGSDENAVADNDGPDVDLYMNDENFAFGGLTDEKPDLYATVFDENGINTVGSGIGHDIVAVLDENTSNSISLNDFYESDLDSYQSGSVRYPFSKLSEGKHTLRIKFWDTYNNSGEGYTEFVVAKSAELALDHVLNYPNPFTTRTSFYFEHNRPGESLDVSIQIFTVSGKLIKSIDTYAASDSYRVGPIDWNGLDEYGDKIGRGVYVYKLKVIAPTGESVDQFEKLVILN